MLHAGCGLQLSKVRCSNLRGKPVSGLVQDLRYALRQLRKSPGFTAVAVITLALGIGANTAIFSVVDAVVLRPLGFTDPDQLVLVKELIPKASPDPIPVSAPDVIQLQHSRDIFRGVAAFVGVGFELSGRTKPERVIGERVNANLFSLLGIAPLLGRTFTTEEDQPGRRVAMLSYALWQRQFGSNGNIIGQTVSLNRQPYIIIGVLPKTCEFPLPGMMQGNAADVFVPMAFTKDELTDIGDNFNFSVLARLDRGISLQRANAELDAISDRILETYPAQFRNAIQLKVLALPLANQIVGDAKKPLFVLLGAVGFVLLIACANIASLLLSRVADRQREIAMRRALGASSLQIVRQLTVESLSLAVIGAALGLLLAVWATKALVPLIPADVPRVHDIALNLPVLVFTVLLTLTTSLIFGLFPAIAASRTRLIGALKEGGYSAVQGLQHHCMRALIVTAEIALSLVLLVGAGLLVRSFQRVLETRTGVQSEHILTASLDLPSVQYSQDQQVRSFYRELMSRLEHSPGVEMAGASTDLPLEGGWIEIFTPEGYQPPPGAGLNTCYNSEILGNYLQTLGVPLIRGRYFNDQDRLDSLPVLLVSESLAKRYWPGQDPIGKRLKQGPPESSDPWLTIVGVVGDVKQNSLDTATAPHTYRPYSQYETPARSLNLAIRAIGAPATLASELSTAIWNLDPELAVAETRTLDQIIHKSTAGRRFNLFLLAVFASLALLLASVGIYGVIAYAVIRRTHEIGIRLALGAHRRDVLRLIVFQGLRLIALGVAIGTLASLALTRLLTSLLYQVQPSDPVAFVCGIGLLVAIAILASYIPARRVAKVDPMVALRYE
jgi:putative ABC transport system permease protein